MKAGGPGHWIPLTPNAYTNVMGDASLRSRRIDCDDFGGGGNRYTGALRHENYSWICGAVEGFDLIGAHTQNSALIDVALVCNLVVVD